MTAYYNEFDPYAAQWLRNLIAAGHIAPGVVDERSIEDVCPDDLRGFTQCHFFAGIGVWSLALRRAGWPDDRPVWTMSCPCQPFSAAGAGAGFADERHLWPAAFHLISQCAPPVVFGEQVASKAVEPWVDLVHADVEALGYAFGCIPFPSAGVGAPHIRDRAYWVAESVGYGRQQGGCNVTRRNETYRRGETSEYGNDSQISWMADSHGGGCEPRGEGRKAVGHGSTAESDSCAGRLADTNGGNSSAEREQRSGEQRQQPQDHGSVQARSASPTNGFWGDVDWLGCRDGNWRPVEPGTFPLAHGATSRVGRLRAYGNAINAEAATQFILAYLEQPNVIYLTPYDRITLTCTGASTDSGFTSLDEVREMMGDPDMAHPRMLTYGDSCFSDFVLSLTPAAPACNTAPNSAHGS